MLAALGAMVEEAGAGPKPITPKEMTEDVDALTKALQFAISPEAKSAAADMAKQIHQEVCALSIASSSVKGGS